jgi:hypothetical protein
MTYWNARPGEEMLRQVSRDGKIIAENESKRT